MGMVKRPFVLLAIAYLLGICAGNSRGFRMCLLPVLLFYLIFTIFMKAYRREKVLFAMPFFLAMGFARVLQAAAPAEIELLVTEKMKCRLYGTVVEASAGANYGKMKIEKVELCLFGEEGKLQEGYLSEGYPEKGYLERDYLSKDYLEKDYLQEKYLPVEGDVLVYVSSYELVPPGSRVFLTGNIRPLSKGDNPGQFDEYQYYKAQGICAVLQGDGLRVVGLDGKRLARFLWKWKQKLQQVYALLLPEQEAGILDAMLLAEKGMLGEETKDLYRNSGISHILAVSGLHVSLIGMGIYQLLKKCKAGANLSIAAAAAVILLYGCFAGFGISIQRAVIMFLLSVLSGWFGKTYDAPTALAVSAMAILIPQPLQLFQAGFLMSFGAVAGILLFSPLLQKMGIKLFHTSLAVQLVLLPVLFWFYYEIPVYSLFLNLVILPFMGLLLVLAMLAGGAGCISMVLGRFFAGGAYVLLKGYELVCKFNEILPGNCFCFGRPSGKQVFFYYFFLLIFYFLCKKFQQKRCLLFLLAFSVFLLPDFSGKLKVTYLAVGQGDCAVIQQGKTTVLMDAGSSVKKGADKILIPYLQYYGDVRIEYVSLSHTDSDHYSMLEEILEEMIEGNPRVTIDTLIMSAAGSEEETYQMLQGLAREAGVTCLDFSAGDGIQFSNMELLCLYPDSSMAGKIKDTNESSLVMLLTAAKNNFLFTGDISAAAEKLVLEELYRINRMKVGFLKDSGNNIISENQTAGQFYLKTAHHGSKYSSSSEFLQALKGCRAIISCGKDNRYGHPHKETLERMEDAGIDYLITWQTGAVRITENRRGVVDIHSWHAGWEQ